MKTIINLIFQVYLPALLMHIGWGMTIPILPLFARELGAGLSVAGLIVSAKGFGPLLMNIPSGMLASRYGNRFVLLAATIVSLLAAVGSGLTRNIPFLAIMVFLTGGAQIVWMMSRVNYVRAVVPLEQRGRVVASIGGIGRIGVFIGPIIGGYVGKYLGLDWVFLARAGITLVVLVQLLLSKRTREIHEPPAEGTSAGLSTVLKLLVEHKKSFLTAGLVTVVFGILRTGRHIVFPLWGEQIGLDVAQIGLIFGLVAAIDMTLFFPAGTIMDRKGRKWTAIPALTIMSLSFLLLPLADTFAVMLIVGLVHGFGNGLGSGIVMTMGSDLSPRQHAGEFLGIWFLVSAMGNLIGPAAIGFLSEILVMSTAALATGGIGVAGGVFMLFFVADTLKKARATKLR